MLNNLRIYHPGELFPTLVRSLVILETFFCFLIYTTNIIYVDNDYHPKSFENIFLLNKYTSLIIFTLGMIVELKTGYYKATKNTEYSIYDNNLTNIIKRYLKTIFIFDLISLITIIYFFDLEKNIASDKK